MIRIKGIPMVAARLLDARNAKRTQTRNKRRRTPKIDAGVKSATRDPREKKAA